MGGRGAVGRHARRDAAGSRLTPASWADDFLHFLLPAGCLACGAWIPGGRAAALVCAPCRTRHRRVPSPACERCGFPRGTGRSAEADCRGCREWSGDLAYARSAWILEPPVSRLVHALKYRGWPELGAPMAQEMARLIPAESAPSRPRWIVPVPTTARRERDRGYNQAAVLADALSRACRMPRRDLLVRSRGGDSQTSLDPARRQANVEGSFSLAPGEGGVCRGADLLLVDDVLTTGATATSAARTLRRAGATRVGLVTYARALPEHARSAA